MAGVDVFDMAPVEVGRMGTMEDPIKVNSIVRSLLLPRGSSSALGERRGLLGRALSGLRMEPRPAHRPRT
jgi:hypothetical protein